MIGTLYGWAFMRAGHTVHFYVREGRSAAYGPTLPISVLDVRPRLRGVLTEETLTPYYIEELAAEHDYDLIVVSVQHYRFAEAAAFLTTRASRATILVFNNFFAEPQEAAASLPSEQLVWGFPIAGGGFDGHGVLRGALFPRIQIGRFGGDAPTERARAVEAFFRQCGFGIQEQADFRGWLFVHFAVNAGLLAQVLHAGSFSQLLASGAERADAMRNVRECLSIVAARGVDLRDHSASTALFRFPPRVAGFLFGLVMKLYAPARLVLDAHTNPEELRFTARDALAEARRLGVPAPRLEALSHLF
ncbi:hypothetical protein AKJ09_00304 [Labilithrix luteola]|uniref:Ketopantoate reductase N-terminal domain-containing protein n=1 Tax=Labilithrix luteola TaxID=1391654 RepID=A0A0K1PJD9_9BACT|nr:hypothetical protein AKJ09_00304 [Labilithrix luteola]